MSVAAQRLEDEAACMRLCVAFASHMDARQYAPLLELFTDDATLDRMGTVMSGRVAISRFLEARPSAVVARHLCTNLNVQFESADEATGSSAVLFCQGTNGDGQGAATMTAHPSVVEYQDRYRRTAAGWRISQRRIRMGLQGPSTEV